MTLGDYIRIFVRRGWIMLLLAVLAAGSAYFLSTRQAPVWRATQVVLLQPSRIDLGLTEASRGVIEQHTAYIDSSLQARQVIERLNLDMQPQDLLANSAIVPNRNNLSVQIEVDSYAPEVAGDLAREWGNLLIQYRNQQNQEARREDRMDAVLQDVPTISQLRPRPRVNALAGGVLGVILGAGVVLLLEFVESSVVRSRDDIERTLSMNVLASIPGE